MDIPNSVFRKMKATAALRGVSLKEFLLSAIEREMANKLSLGDYTVASSPHPVQTSGQARPDNAEIEDLLA